MDEKKKKTLFSILNGKIKVDKYLNEFQNIEKQLKDKFDLDVQASFNRAYEQFQINLYNFFRSFKEQNKYFEDYKKINAIISKSVELKTWKEVSTKYTFEDLFNSFRNRNEHYDKINREEEYILFKTSISREQLMELYNCCCEVLNTELNKLDFDDVIKFVFSNTELKSSFAMYINSAIQTNEQSRDQYPKIYELNDKMINQFKEMDLDMMNLKKFNDLYYQLKEYLLHEEFKNEFISRYGSELYNSMLESYESEDSTFEEDKLKINFFFNRIYEIENQLNPKIENEQ